jgi:nucleolin
MGERGDDTAKKPKKDKKDKKDKKEKKEKRERDDADDATASKKTKKPEPVPAAEEGLEELEEEEEGLVFKSAEDGGKVKTKAGGAAPPALGAFPTSSTSVYMGNLAWSIDEDAIKQAFEDCGEVLSINWFEEKETKKFMVGTFPSPPPNPPPIFPVVALFRRGDCVALATRLSRCTHGSSSVEQA